MKRPIEYGAYKEILDIAERTNVEDSYQDLMGKEKQVLETVNNVVKYYRDDDIKNGEFINQGFATIYARFFDVWKDILNDYTSAGYNKSMLTILTQGDRPIYVGIGLIVIALFLFFIESSNW